jgi:CRISPR-associated protein Csb2
MSSLFIEVTLVSGRYDAGAYDPRVPEVIPSPHRLLCALVASAGACGTAQDFDTLRWLEQQPPPVVHVTDPIDDGVDGAYVVTNRIERTGGSQTWAARTNGRRERSWVTFGAPSFIFEWPDVSVEAGELSRLQRLAGAVPYFGRVTSRARLRVDVETKRDLSRHRAYRPVSLRERGVDIPAPYPGLVDALVDAHERGDRSWEVARFRRYAVVEQAGEASTIAWSPFEHLAVFRFADGASVDGSHILKLTASFRKAVMSCAAAVFGEEHLPEALHGHIRGPCHMAFLGLPFVGHARADGRLLGLALAVPEAGRPEHVELLNALTAQGSHSRLERLDNVFRKPLQLEYEPLPRSPRTLRIDRWGGWNRTHEGSQRWVTATPMMVDRFPRSADRIADEVAADLVTAGFPEPVDVTVSPTPLVPGGLRWSRSWLRHLNAARQTRPVVHARVVFPVPVRGPVLAGSLRYVGAGLFCPDDVERDVTGKDDQAVLATTGSARQGVMS